MNEEQNTVVEYLLGLERRIKFLEDTIVTLLVALKESGVITDSDEESSDKQYQFNFE
mgnify:CR=1 FL=1